MSTELFEAKAMADEIHDAAGVPEARNPDVYTMTIDMITRVIVGMDAHGMSMAQQRTLMGRKKDELIVELKRLREQGVLNGDAGLLNRKAAPVRVNMGSINKRA